MKASAAEYLDNLLDSQVRKRVMPVLEDLPIEEKVRRGNLLLKTRVRDAEDSLAQLVHDEDQIVAAAAMHFVEQRGLWASLADDLEYALEHRDPKDWYVFEAASWALAGQRLTAEQRQKRWLEPLPAVELADRLARLPLFKITTVDELFRIAGTGRQVRHEPGRTIYEAGRRAVGAAVPARRQRHARAGRRGRHGRRGRRDRRARRRSASTRCSKGCRRRRRSRPAASPSASRCSTSSSSACSRRTPSWRRASSGCCSTRTAARPGARCCATSRIRRSAARLRDGLQPIEKVLVLEEMPVFSRASSDQLAALAGITREVKLTEGEVLFGAGDAPAIHIVLEGELSLEPMDGGTPMSAGAGRLHRRLRDARRARPDRLARPRHARRRGLRVDREALFDLLADQIDLLQGLFSALQRQPAVQAARQTVDV